jgi:hypothetical protein
MLQRPGVAGAADRVLRLDSFQFILFKVPSCCDCVWQYFDSNFVGRLQPMQQLLVQNDASATSELRAGIFYKI